ncbi:hypothetical protein [Paracoccus sp. KR1-242]|uniref:hypothetical protein n=1 Tax=Paracoccus sp. KR1-242 TaxID=3410028 RepID=UPI003C03E2B9
MGRDRKNEAATEHWTKMLRSTMETPAWRALTATGQALYPWIKMEWKGPQANNNGKISLAVRTAAERVGCGRDTAARAFHDLQAKGFLLLTSHGRMGVEGKGAPPTYEITELAIPGSDSNSGKKLYLHWRPGHDFPVSGHAPVNPTGRNGRENKTPSSKSGRNVIKMRTKT